jgi:ubiquinone/menaquinone biosynthesis C-methylase UbiE
MGLYSEQVVPRIIDKACGGPDMAPLRDRTCEGLSGVIVELGFGSGLNVASYPDDVTRVLAIEPSTVGRSLGADRISASRAPIEFSGLRGESLPLDDDSCDGALCTFTLCTIPDVDAAMHELLRVLRPGAPFHFLEHGVAPDPKVRRWQHRLEPLQKRLADGCHLTRQPVEIVRSAGFRIESFESSYLRGPKPWVYFTFGRATAPQ